MPDREKVIQGLKCCAEDKCQKCPFVRNGEDYEHCQKLIMRKVLELLKKVERDEENQPAKPREERHEVKINHEWGDEVEVWSEFYCPHCGAMIAEGKSEHYPRCMWCGKAVKWDDD